MSTSHPVHALLQYHRDDSTRQSSLIVDLSKSGSQTGKLFLGSFIENLSDSFSLGLSAELLCNPTFCRDANLTSVQQNELVTNGKLLTRLYLSGGDPDVLKPGWTYTPLATGFGLAILDDFSKDGLPLGWGPLGYPGSVSASVGRVGAAVRLLGGSWPADPNMRWPVTTDGPAGVYQGIFLPIHRCQVYHGEIWARISTLEGTEHGQLEVGLRRRVATRDGSRQAGESLAACRLKLSGSEWVCLDYEFDLIGAQITQGEPVDFYVRWIPLSNPGLQVLLDRVELYPQDMISGLDPEIVKLARDWTIPLLRFPGGNFVSYYHWRDGVGPKDLRPTYANYAWGGLDYNLLGTDELIQFCCLIGAEPHITVNSGTGSPEEAAAWVEYCNGDQTTPMGRLRAKNGHPEPYNVSYWEVGNENFGAWQGGFHGSDENARRFTEFALAMRAASPMPIELIACGNNFDFAIPGPGYDHAHADRRWHDQLLLQAPNDIDYVSLHSLPVNDHLLENASDEQAHQAVLGQVTTWERHFLPDLLSRCTNSARDPQKTPIRLAITEWGPLGSHPNRLMVENFGGVVYVGAFLNMMLRNADQIPIANTTGFMHGGCIRKTFGITFYDPQYLAIQQYAPYFNSIPLACKLTGPGFDVDKAADLGAVEKNVPYIDAVACRPADGKGLLLSITNKSLTETMTVVIQIPGYTMPDEAKVTSLSYPDITARTDPAQPHRFALSKTVLIPNDGKLTISLAPFSVNWLKV